MGAWIFGARQARSCLLKHAMPLMMAESRAFLKVENIISPLKKGSDPLAGLVFLVKFVAPREGQTPFSTGCYAIMRHDVWNDTALLTQPDNRMRYACDDSFDSSTIKERNVHGQENR